MSDTSYTAARPKVVTDAIAFQTGSGNAFAGQRKREIDDLRCQVPKFLWPEDVAQARSGSTIGGVTIPPRPMLSIPKLDQPIQLQMNQLRQAHLGVQIHPVSKDADTDTATMLQGYYRFIERDSRANLAREWGADRGMKCGMGWYRVNVVYDDTTDDPTDLKIRIERILRQGSVFPDPFAQEPDFSDGKKLLYASFMAQDAFKAAYPKAKLASYDDDTIANLAELAPFWFEGEGEQRAVCVAEYFYTEYRDREWVILDNGAWAYADEIPTGRMTHPTAGKTRKVKEPILKWCKLNACEVLEETEWNGKYIPFVPCIGKELQTFDAERRWFGIYSTNKDSAHLFNVAVSNAVEISALEPKAPWIGYTGQFKTNNKQWQLANTRNIPYLEADLVMINGQIAPLPQRTQHNPNLGASVALIEIADNNLQAGTAMYDALLGKTDRDDSGKKVLALQDQSLASNSHWIANLADISMTYESLVILDMLPRILDRQGRVVRILGEDGEQQEAILNHPFVIDPNTKRPVPVPEWNEGDPIPPNTKYYNLKKGTYGRAVTIGKSYQTRAQQGADAFSQLLMAQPDLIKFVGDIWMGFQDFPGHELAAKRLKAAIPPEIKQVDDEQGGPDPQQLQAELQKAEQGAQMMKSIIEEQAKAIETDQIKETAESQRAVEEHAAKLQIEKVKATLAITLQKMKDDHAYRLEQLKQAHADLEREDEQAHETALAAADDASAREQAEAQATHDAAMAAASALDADDKAERSHEHSMESQSQSESAAEKQAKMKPKAGEK